MKYFKEYCIIYLIEFTVTERSDVMSEVVSYKCPCCNAPLVYDAKKGTMSCEYCGTNFSAEDTADYIDAMQTEGAEDVYEWEEYSSESGSGDWTEDEKTGMRTYICPSCGGGVIGDENTVATSCPYCGNPTVISENTEDVFKPDMIIPFKVTKDEAKAALKKHCKGKHLLPKFFADDNRIEEIKGIYVPFWFFDCDTDSDISYRATRSRFWSDSNYNYTETSHFLVRRAGTLSFEGIPVDGSSKIDNIVMQSIEPFNKADMVPFEKTYLAGFLADKYDVDPDILKPGINQRVKNSVDMAFRSTVRGYSSVVTTSSNVNIKQGKVRYGLMPVWILNTNYNGKTYSFAMNGDTGKFVGDLPISWKRFWGYLVGITAAITVVGTAAMTILSIM